ncbi:hypothetical protein A3Q56_03032 [Intoshia linei]|uniref:Uncharacterized protein n=1 Tax=Intoshia linei TaxID=1819745 RepID=A0A177B4M4_9BILA|nr:hypothetical protein A3Q56_03032 [Intoshia linei]
MMSITKRNKLEKKAKVNEYHETVRTYLDDVSSVEAKNVKADAFEKINECNDVSEYSIMEDFKKTVRVSRNSMSINEESKLMSSIEIAFSNVNDTSTHDKPINNEKNVTSSSNLRENCKIPPPLISEPQCTITSVDMGNVESDHFTKTDISLVKSVHSFTGQNNCETDQIVDEIIEKSTSNNSKITLKPSKPSVRSKIINIFTKKKKKKKVLINKKLISKDIIAYDNTVVKVPRDEYNYMTNTLNVDYRRKRNNDDLEKYPNIRRSKRNYESTIWSKIASKTLKSTSSLISHRSTIPIQHKILVKSQEFKVNVLIPRDYTSSNIKNIEPTVKYRLSSGLISVIPDNQYNVNNADITLRYRIREKKFGSVLLTIQINKSTGLTKTDVNTLLVCNVLKGTALVMLNNKKIHANSGDDFFIPAANSYSITNTSTFPLKLHINTHFIK